MDKLRQAIKQMISVSDPELDQFQSQCLSRSFRRQELLLRPGAVPNEIFFIEQGLVRVVVTDQAGTEHTIHFALEHQFITDYSSFMLQQPSLYSVQALEETQVVVLPRSAIEWGYAHLYQGDKLGRLVAEFYFIYQDNRIRNLYARTPKERYDTITDVFPNIHNRAPQHMIASYLGITPVHLSRLKKADRPKV
ncbi:Crp/Fnr family transcriptional regulator [Telluribacter humicola]|uniref:Crp/Fnr family transcriptional regulator n=1 Tax=Telluribacter humicola TaxID=1720261 RepID=UPI001A97D098|nr:Crp/Fnr family transcriptional regulator [Telluribacter humicola]